MGKVIELVKELEPDRVKEQTIAKDAETEKDQMRRLAEALREIEQKLMEALECLGRDYNIDFTVNPTRGLRDRSPTTRTTSARSYQPSGARDALREGCRKGLLLYPGLCDRYPAQKEQAKELRKASGHFAERSDHLRRVRHRNGAARGQRGAITKKTCRAPASALCDGGTETMHEPRRHLRQSAEVRER